MINYNNKKFWSVENSANGEVSGDTVFHYRQEGDVVWGSYTGGSIRFGNLIARADQNRELDMRYQHLSEDGTFKTGICRSKPEILTDGRIRLHEAWQWTSGDQSKGSSIIEEIKSEPTTFNFKLSN